MLSHHNAFYEMAGGDKKSRGYKFPHLLLEVTLAVLRAETHLDLIGAAEASLQTYATKARIDIELETATFRKTLRP